jgi:tetratricopeptide (TPR) repeat protein
MISRMKFKKALQFFVLVFCLLLPVLSFGDDGATTLFQKGNAAYAKEKYSDAIAAYSQVLADGNQSAALFFNIGNAYYKTGDIPSAILYYEKAHKLAPGDDDINFNLKYANLKTSDRVDAIQEFFLTRWWRAIVLISSADNLAIWSVLLLILGSAILSYYFFAGSVSAKKASFYVAMILFTFGVLTLFLANRQVSYFDSHHEAIVFAGAVEVKSAPAGNGSLLFVIHDGTKVNILDANNGWLKISLPNGNEGWIKSSAVKEI